MIDDTELQNFNISEIYQRWSHLPYNELEKIKYRRNLLRKHQGTESLYLNNTEPTEKYIKDYELVKLKIKDINQKFKHLPKNEVQIIKNRMRTLKKCIYKNKSLANIKREDIKDRVIKSLLKDIKNAETKPTSDSSSIPEDTNIPNPEDEEYIVDIDVDQVIESLLKDTENVETEPASDPNPTPQDTNVLNPEYIDDIELVQIRVKDINQRFKHLRKAKIRNIKKRMRTLKNSIYKRKSRKKQNIPVLGSKIATWSTRQTDPTHLDKEAKAPTDELTETEEPDESETEEPDELTETEEPADESETEEPDELTETEEPDEPETEELDIYTFSTTPNTEYDNMEWIDDALALFSHNDYTTPCTKNDIFGVYMCQCRDCKIQANTQDELYALPSFNQDNCICKYTLAKCVYECTKNDAFGVYMCNCCDCKIKAKMQF